MPRRFHPRASGALAVCLLLAYVTAACRDPDGAASRQATPPAQGGQVERNVSLTAGGSLALPGEASAVVRARTGTGSATLRISRIGTPAQTVEGAPWLKQVGNLIQLETLDGPPPSSVNLQLKLLKDRLPENAGEEQVFIARVQQGVILPQPTRVNLRGLTATVAVSEPGTFAAFAIDRSALIAAVREAWGTPPALERMTTTGSCPVSAGALIGSCRRPAPDGNPRRAVVETVNPHPFYLEVAFAGGQGAFATPRDAVTCITGALLPPGGRMTWLVNATTEEVRDASVMLAAAPSPCAQFVQTVMGLMTPVIGLDPKVLLSIAAGWYDQVSGHKLLRSAQQAWEAGDRAAWAADVATFLLNPDRLGALAETLNAAGAAVGEPQLREQVFTAGDVLDAVGGLRAMLAAPAFVAGGVGGVPALELSFRFPSARGAGTETAQATPPTTVATPAPASTEVAATPPRAASGPSPAAASGAPLAPTATPDTLPADVGRIVVAVQREGVEVTASVSLAPAVHPAMTIPADATTASFDRLPPGTYTIALEAFGCSRSVEVRGGTTLTVRILLTVVADTGGFRCAIQAV